MALVESALDGGVLTVTLNDEARRNALEHRPAGRAGRHPRRRRCRRRRARHRAHQRRHRVLRRGQPLRAVVGAAGGRTVDMAAVFARFRRSPKPYVGRIAGHCVAGGMGLAAAMDISVAVDTAKFGFTEVRVGRGARP